MASWTTTDGTADYTMPGNEHENQSRELEQLREKCREQAAEIKRLRAGMRELSKKWNGVAAEVEPGSPHERLRAKAQTFGHTAGELDKLLRRPRKKNV